LTEEDGPRNVSDVFASPAPPVLDMHTYLEQRRRDSCMSSLGPSRSEDSDRLGGDCLAKQDSQEDNGGGKAASATVTKVPEELIQANRMSEEEIRELPGGKFVNYTPGSPSSVGFMFLTWLPSFLLKVLLHSSKLDYTWHNQSGLK
jgi:hypothetical protein